VGVITITTVGLAVVDILIITIWAETTIAPDRKNLACETLNKEAVNSLAAAESLKVLMRKPVQVLQV
jgi:hypothetical protein